MAFVPALLLFAQSAVPQAPASNDVGVEVSLRHQRPSRLVKTLEGIYGAKLAITPHDEQSTLSLLGDVATVESAKASVSLFDVEPVKVRLRVRVENPIAHAEWTAELTLTNNRMWKGTDESTETDLALSPRVNADGTLTLYVSSQESGTPKWTMVLRIKPNEPSIVGMPLDSKPPRAVDATERPKEPRVTLTYLGLRPNPEERNEVEHERWQTP